jgi:L-asparaginase II
MTYLLIAASSILCILVMAYSLYRLNKINLSQTEKIAGLQSQLAILCSGAVGTDEKINRFEQALSQLKEYQNTLDLGMTHQPGYDHAIRLAKKGVNISQLIENCNLSHEEAHLISRMHGAQLHTKKKELH